jgi:hypothetical protein
VYGHARAELGPFAGQPFLVERFGGGEHGLQLVDQALNKHRTLDRIAQIGILGRVAACSRARRICSATLGRLA